MTASLTAKLKLSDDLSYEKVQTVVNQRFKHHFLAGSSPASRTKIKPLEFQRFKGFFLMYQRFPGIQLFTIEHIVFMYENILPLKMSYVLSYDKSTGVAKK